MSEHQVSIFSTLSIFLTLSIVFKVVFKYPPPNKRTESPSDTDALPMILNRNIILDRFPKLSILITSYKLYGIMKF